MHQVEAQAVQEVLLEVELAGIGRPSVVAIGLSVLAFSLLVLLSVVGVLPPEQLDLVDPGVVQPVPDLGQRHWPFRGLFLLSL